MKHVFRNDKINSVKDCRPVRSTRLPIRAHGRLKITCASRADNRGDLRLFLDSASVFQWEKYAEREIFYGRHHALLPLQSSQFFI